MQLHNYPHGEAIVPQRDIDRERLKELAKRQTSQNDDEAESRTTERKSSAAASERSDTPSNREALSPNPGHQRHSRRASSSDEQPYLPVGRPDNISDVLEPGFDVRDDKLEIMADIGPQPEKPAQDPPPTMTTRTEQEVPSVQVAEPDVDLNTPLSEIAKMQQQQQQQQQQHHQQVAESPALTQSEFHRRPSVEDTISLTVSNDSRHQSIDYEPIVVGDHLKIQFIEHHVVPTILDLFFRFPWNNFLHNVVYDVVQQVFNGPMDRGYNRVLAIDVFVQGAICEKIVQGQKRSEEAVASKGVRLGYMGHLTLIAEEVVKFVERFPPRTISPLIEERVNDEAWVNYVETTLAETRARDSAILGGVRPTAPQHQQARLQQEAIEAAATQPEWSNEAGAYDSGGAFQYSFQGDEGDGDEDDRELERRLDRFNMTGDDDDEDDDMEDDNGGVRRQYFEQDDSDQFASYISQQIAGDPSNKFGSSDEDEESDDDDAAGRAHYWSNAARRHGDVEEDDGERVDDADDASHGIAIEEAEIDPAAEEGDVHDRARSRPVLSLGDSSESSDDEDEDELHTRRDGVRSPPQTASPAAERSSLDEA